MRTFEVRAVLKKSVTFLTPFLGLYFSACALNGKHANENEPVESQPVVISGKNVFTLKNGSVECGYRAKTATEYALFCHAYTHAETQSGRGAIGLLDVKPVLATEFEAGVSLDWQPPTLQSAPQLLITRVCRVMDEGLGYVCHLSFAEQIIGQSKIDFAILAEAHSEITGERTRKEGSTDLRDPAKIADNSIVEKAGENPESFLTQEELKENEEKLKEQNDSDDDHYPTPTPTPSPSPTPSPDPRVPIYPTSPTPTPTPTPTISPTPPWSPTPTPSPTPTNPDLDQLKIGN